MSDNDETKKIRLKEEKNRIAFQTPTIIKLKYPHLQDSQLQKKITLKKEFQTTHYDGTLKQLTKKDKSCKKSDFTLAPHQEFLKIYMSRHTPYNGLLLYHGMGSGKTCSAISICEEYRKYNKHNPGFKKILIIASPNVQENFKLQLFDKSKLIQKNGIWYLDGCVGESLLQEMKFFDIERLSKEDIISKMEKQIKKHYEFMGYVEFANKINKVFLLEDKKQMKKMKQLLKQEFSEKMVVVDEVHNIRTLGETKKTKQVASSFQHLLSFVKHIKLLFLSGTPMYNDPTEIIFLMNLLLSNDGQSKITKKEIFNKHGDFIEGGKEQLLLKCNGYISYVRGENPYQFPFKVYPNDYGSASSLHKQSYPTKQFNEKPIDDTIHHLDLHCTTMSSYQQQVYTKSVQTKTQMFDSETMKKFKEADSFKYTMLQEPLQALTFGFKDEKSEQIYVGKSALHRVVAFDSDKQKYTYIDSTKRIFAFDTIGDYSGKIKSILEHIQKSEGIILIYSQYLDAGLIPMALALEEMGFTRTRASKHRDLLYQSGPKKQTGHYSMITGDIKYSTSNKDELQYINHIGNKNGDLCKVVLISQAGSEGLDFKHLRQVHILEPWYNLNRIDQIIGRAIRNCSHKELPLKKRNCQIFLHATIQDNDEECIDMMMYRLAELKAIKIGAVQKVLKSISVDCLLNSSQQNFSQLDQKVDLTLSTKQQIKYDIKDKPFSSLCDHDICEYKCYTSLNGTETIDNTTFHVDHLIRETIVRQIKRLYQKQHIFRKKQLIDLICSPFIHEEHLNYALSYLINNENETLVDKFMRRGYLINVKDLYIFKPQETNDILSLQELQKPFQQKRHSFSHHVQNMSNNDDSPQIENVLKPIDVLLQHMKRQYEMAFLLHTIQFNDDDYYTLFYATLQPIMEHFSTLELQPYLKQIVFEHMMEELSIEQELLLINHVFHSSWQPNEFESLIKSYYQKNIYAEKGVLFLVDLKKKPKKKNNDLIQKHIRMLHYIDSSWKDLTKSEIKDIQYETLVDFLTKKHDDYTSENLIYGFKDFDMKQNEYALKTCSIVHKGYGAFFHNKIPQFRKDQLNSIMNTSYFQSKKDLNKTQYSIIMESLLKYFHYIQKENKSFYFDKLSYATMNLKN